MPVQTPPVDERPLIDRTGSAGGVRRLLFLGGFLFVFAATLALFGHAYGTIVLLSIFALLSVLGLFAVFAFALGLVTLTTRRTDDGMSRQFLDEHPVGTLITDHKGRIVYANRAYGLATGASEAGAVKTLERLLAREVEASEAIYRLANSARDGQWDEEEFRLSRNLVEGGSGPCWYRASVRPLERKPGALRIWQIADVTRERREQESFFQDLQHAIDYLDHAPAGFFAADEDGRVTYLNATLAGWLGIDLASFKPGSLTVDDFTTRDGRAFLRAMGDEAGDSRTRILDVDLKKTNGQRLPVRLLRQTIRASDGAPGPARTLVLNRSIENEGVTTHEAAEMRFMRFFNSSPMAIASLDGTGRATRANAAFARLFGHGAAEGTIGFDEVIGAEHREAIAAALGAAGAGQAGILPVDVDIAGDQPRSVRLYFSTISDLADDSGDATIVYGVDFTDQRALEEQFARAQRMQAIGNLAGGIAHDFNNVLTIITASVDFLLLNHRSGDPSFQDLLLIKQSANRAASLVRQLLAYSRRQTMRPKMLSLTDVVADMHLLLKRISGDIVKLERHHGRDLWPVMADIGQFEQVITNLVQNARDAMPEGGTITIATRNVAEDEVGAFGYAELGSADYVLVEVEDTGSGMSEELTERIFEPFFTTKEIGKGTGLGLSMVYGIVKQSGGFVFVESTLGTGTVFRIFLPRHVPTEVAPARIETTGQASNAKMDLSGTASILLVEDEDHVRAGNVRALKMRGYEVHEASSGIEALEVMEEIGGQIDLVVSDVVMPEMDGPTLLREMRKTRPELKFIFVSGYAEDAFAKNLPDGEKFGFLAKPFSLRELAVAVRDMLDE